MSVQLNGLSIFVSEMSILFCSGQDVRAYESIIVPLTVHGLPVPVSGLSVPVSGLSVHVSGLSVPVSWFYLAR